MSIDSDPTLTDREKNGCVVRALESFFGANATDDEWEMRLNTLKPKLVLLTQINIQIPNLVVRNGLRKMVFKEDLISVRRYMDILSEHNTPLGRAIRSTALCYTIQNWKETESILLSGTDLLVVCGMVLKKNEGFIGHMAHLRRAIIQKDGIFSVSDQDFWYLNFSDDYFTFRKA